MQHVALRTEGVDRNFHWNRDSIKRRWSPSARRAWIEISETWVIISLEILSPSARRAWIEICFVQTHPGGFQSPSARRAWIEIRQRLTHDEYIERRPPHGGRG